MATKTEVSKTKPAEISVTEAADNLGALLNRVAFGGEEIVITRHEKPAAKLVPIDSAA